MKKYHSFYLEESLLKKLQEQAAKEGRSFNNYVIKILSDHAKAYDSKNEI